MMDGNNWYAYYDEKGNRGYTYFEGQLTEDEAKAKGYTDMGFSFVDPILGVYYSLFGKQVKYLDDDGRYTFEGQMYKRIDDLIIATYSQKDYSDPLSQEVHPLPKGSFYFRNLKHAVRFFNYDGKGFQSDRDHTVFRNLENEENSILHIGKTPKQQEEILHGFFGASWKGHFIVLYNNKGWDVITINYNNDNAQTIISLWNKLFPNQ